MICGLVGLSYCFSALTCSWIIPSKINHNFSFVHSRSHGELLFGNLFQSLLVCSGDSEINSGPKTKTQTSFCHWNLNGLAAHNFTKFSLLQALSVTHDYDINCLSETFFDSSVSNEDERINIKGYNLLRSEHPSIRKRPDVCMHYKEHLSIINRDDLCSLKECLLTEIIVDKKRVFFRVCIDHQVRLKMNLRSFVIT